MKEKYCSIELYMKDKYIFPDKYLGDAQNLPDLSDRIYDIYFILQGDSYKINDIGYIGSLLLIKIKNITKDTFCEVQFDIFKSFRVPDASFLHTELLDDNAVLKLEYNVRGEEYLKKSDSNAYDRYKEYKNTNGCFQTTIHARELLNMQMRSFEHEQEYDILYIGQSKRENIFDRLGNHSTLQTIMRDSMRSGSNKELYILISSIGVKHIDRLPPEVYNTSFVFSTTLDRAFELDNKINGNCMIDIAEAMLISHFKPPYNNKLKRSSELGKLKTYKKIGDININTIALSIDLFWADAGEKMILRTNEVNTTSKGRLLECHFLEDDVKLEYDDISDALYNLF